MMSLTASALALVFGSAAAADIDFSSASDADAQAYFMTRMGCTMKLDGSIVTGTSKGDALGAPTCPKVEGGLGSIDAACNAKIAALKASGITTADFIKTFEITEESVKNLGTRAKGYDAWQPDKANRKWGQWVDPEHPMCGNSTGPFAVAAVACGTITSTMAHCGPKYTKYDESKYDNYKGGKDKMVPGLYQLCGPHQTTVCEDTIYDTAGVLFFVICGASLVIIFFQCSLMGLYDVLFSSKPEAGDGGAASKATNQP